MNEPETDVATALARRFEDGAELVDAGGFTLDHVRARGMLAERRLAEPDAFVLLLVEAAHLLPGCTELRFAIAPRVTEVELIGAALDGADLRGMFDALAVDATVLEPDAARREHGRQRLALAIFAVVGREVERARWTKRVRERGQPDIAALRGASQVHKMLHAGRVYARLELEVALPDQPLVPGTRYEVWVDATGAERIVFDAELD